MLLLASSLVRLLLVLAATLALAAPGRAQLSVPAPGGAETAPAADAAAGVAEALRLLAVVLEDPEARAVLVEQLRAAETAAAADPAAAPAEDADRTVPELIADESLALFDRAGDGVLGVVRGLVDIRDLLADVRGLRWEDVGRSVTTAALAVAVTVGALLLARAAARPVLRRLDGRAAAASAAGRQLWRLLAVLVDLAAVAAAWLLAIAVAVFSFDEGAVSPAQALYLQAFFWTELVRVAIRAAFRPRRFHLRLVAVPEAVARHWNFWLARVVGVLGYGLVFLAPLVESEGAPRASAWVGLAAVVLAYGMAAVLILRNRRAVQAALKARVGGLRPGVVTGGLAALARVWHLLALGYVTALLVVWRAHPGDAEAFMLRATGWSALAVLLGSIAAAFLTRRIDGGIVVGPALSRTMPGLEARLNRVVPLALNVARFLVAAVVVTAVVAVWGLVDLHGFVATETGRAILLSGVWILGILAAAGAAWVAVASWVEYRLNPDLGREPTARERTLLALFSNAFVVVLIVGTLMAVLSEIGINIAPLLAGAGVVGLAIGFGAQKLVQDIINGAFIQVENTMNEGDIVTAGTTTGVVEKLTIRSVSLRDVNGNLHMIPFSGVDSVTNFTKTFSFHVADIGVAYRENIAEVKAAMHAAFDQLMETEHRATILPPLQMFGVEALADSAVIVRARIKTLPGKQWDVGRAYNEVIKEVFDARGIEMPFPHRTIYFGEGRDGDAPPLTIRRAPGPALPGADGAG